MAEDSGNWWQWPAEKGSQGRKSKKGAGHLSPVELREQPYHPYWDHMQSRWLEQAQQFQSWKAHGLAEALLVKQVMVVLPWTSFRESGPSLLLMFRQPRSCCSVLQTFIPWQIYESCTLRHLSASMYGQFETTIKVDPGTSMLVHPDQLINISACSCAWSGILEN